MELGAYRKQQVGYRAEFTSGYGPFPHDCFFCGLPVEPWSGKLDRLAPVIHHLDEDRSNSDPANLVPAHHGCHVSFHARKDGRVRNAHAGRDRMTFKQRQQRSRRAADTYRARTTPSERHVSAMKGASAVRLVTCPACGRKMMGNGGYHSHLAKHARLGELSVPAT